MRRGIRPRRYSFPLLAGGGVAAEGRRGGPASNALLQFRQQPPQRLAAVAHEIFLLGIELGGGLAEVAQEKMRIVAEPVRAAGLGDDLARPDSLGDHRFGILRVAQENDDAVVVRHAEDPEPVIAEGIWAITGSGSSAWRRIPN